MKIWTVTDNSEQISTEVCLTPEARDAAVAEWVADKWKRWKGDAPMPDSIETATDVLYATTGFLDSIHTDEHEIPCVLISDIAPALDPDTRRAELQQSIAGRP